MGWAVAGGEGLGWCVVGAECAVDGQWWVGEAFYAKLSDHTATVFTGVYTGKAKEWL
jgi:hypothetical protein